MLRFSYLNAIFREPWMIEPETAAANRQVLVGLLQGLEFSPEETVASYAIGHKEFARIPQGRKVNVVNLMGTMMRDDGDCGQIGTRTLAQQINEADADPKVIGHILAVDSGGGASNSVDDLAEAISSATKPVVAYVDGMMCSAAMFAASYCASIIAHNEMDRVGCIGTLVQIEGWPKEVKESDGYIRLRIYADGSEEKNGEYEAALAGDFKLIKENTLNPLNERFKAAIRTNRPTVKEDQLKGRTYFARDAVGTLIDSLGDFDSAVAKVIEISNIKITNMEGFKKLQALPSCGDLQEVDGTVTLNREQLGEIENALLDNEQMAATRRELDTANSTISTQAQENASLRSDIAQRDTRISELQGTIEQLQGRPSQPAQPVRNGNPSNGDEVDNSNPEDYCKQLHKKLYG